MKIQYYLSLCLHFFSFVRPTLLYSVDCVLNRDSNNITLLPKPFENVHLSSVHDHPTCIFLSLGQMPILVLYSKAMILSRDYIFFPVFHDYSMSTGTRFLTARPGGGGLLCLAF